MRSHSTNGLEQNVGPGMLAGNLEEKGEGEEAINQGGLRGGSGGQNEGQWGL